MSDNPTASVVRINHKHNSLETRKRKRASMLRLIGRSEHQPAEMLDLYLGGDCVREIAEAYNISTSSVYNSIAKEALFRLMSMKAAERLEEIDGIGKSDQ